MRSISSHNAIRKLSTCLHLRESLLIIVSFLLKIKKKVVGAWSASDQGPKPSAVHAILFRLGVGVGRGYPPGTEVPPVQDWMGYPSRKYYGMDIGHPPCTDTCENSTFPTLGMRVVITKTDFNLVGTSIALGHQWEETSLTKDSLITFSGRIWKYEFLVLIGTLWFRQLNFGKVSKSMF